MGLISEIKSIKKTFEIISDVEIKYALTKEAMDRTSSFLHKTISILDEDGLYDDLLQWEDIEWEVNRWLFKDGMVMGKCNCDVDVAWGYIDKVLNYWS